jgi:hypothetical protein
VLRYSWAPFAWHWRGEGGRWEPYPDEVSAALERSWRAANATPGRNGHHRHHAAGATGAPEPTFPPQSVGGGRVVELAPMLAAAAAGDGRTADAYQYHGRTPHRRRAVRRALWYEKTGGPATQASGGGGGGGGASGTALVRPRWEPVPEDRSKALERAALERQQQVLRHPPANQATSHAATCTIVFHGPHVHHMANQTPRSLPLPR